MRSCPAHVCTPASVLTTQVLDVDGDGRVWQVLFLPCQLICLHLKADMGTLARQQLYTVLKGAATCCDECNQLQWWWWATCGSVPPPVTPPAWRKQHLPLPWTIPSSSSLLGSKWAVELPAEMLRQRRMGLWKGSCHPDVGIYFLLHRGYWSISNLDFNCFFKRSLYKPLKHTKNVVPQTCSELMALVIAVGIAQEKSPMSE